RLAPLDDDPELTAEARDGPQRILDAARVDVLPPHHQHVVEAPVDAGRQPGIGTPARTRLVRPARPVTGDQTDHGLGRALEVRVDRRPLAAVRHSPLGDRVADLRVDEVLPEMHASPRRTLRVGHPRTHLGHAARVDADAAERLLDQALRRRDARARLAGEEQDAEAEAPGIDALP